MTYYDRHSKALNVLPLCQAIRVQQRDKTRKMNKNVESYQLIHLCDVILYLSSVSTRIHENLPDYNI